MNTTRLSTLTAALVTALAIIVAAPSSADAERLGGHTAIDGDSFHGSLGEVRIIGIDTPEAGHPCWNKAKARLQTLLNADADGLPAITVEQGTDKYGRRLLSLDIETGSGRVFDLGMAMINSGYAVARYDSQDGYPSHPQEDAYRAKSKLRAKDNCVPETEDDHILTVAAAAAAAEEQRQVAAAIVAYANGVADYEREQERIRVEEENRRVSEENERRQREQQQASDSGGGSSSGKYTGPRCYAPGGKTWKPC